MNHSDYLTAVFFVQKKTGGGKSILFTRLSILEALKDIVDFILFSKVLCCLWKLVSKLDCRGV